MKTTKNIHPHPNNGKYPKTMKRVPVKKLK